MNCSLCQPCGMIGRHYMPLVGANRAGAPAELLRTCVVVETVPKTLHDVQDSSEHMTCALPVL